MSLVAAQLPGEREEPGIPSGKSEEGIADDEVDAGAEEDDGTTEQQVPLGGDATSDPGDNPGAEVFAAESPDEISGSSSQADESVPIAVTSGQAGDEAPASQEPTTGPLPPPPLVSHCGLGFDSGLVRKLVEAAGVDLTVPWRGRLKPTLLLPDGERITAEARAASWGQCPPLEYLPMYWPQGFPGQQLSDFREELLAEPRLLQGRVNPYALAAERVAMLDEDPRERRRAAEALALYAAVHRHAAPEDLAWTLFKQPTTVFRDALYSMAVEALERLKPSLAKVSVGEGEVAVDLRVLSYASHDSASSLREILVAAARRGLKAVVVADRNTMAGARDAENVVYQLKREGLLPPDFVVIPGQTVDSFSGSVLAIFVRSRVPDGMTSSRTVEEIHQQGGLAIAIHPGQPGGAHVLKLVPFDGYLIQPAFFEMFRTQELMADPELERLVPLYGSGARFPRGVGYPYSAVEAPDGGEEGLRRAALQGRIYAASPLLLPYMTAVALKPIGPVMHYLNKYFVVEEKLWLWLARRLGAQNVRVELSWDRAVREMMGLAELPTHVERLFDGTSVLLRRPEVLSVSIEYKMFRLAYFPSPRRYVLQMA
ncbi:MAG: hypothetical protein N2512_05940, partial [Armatimonadetes bacterium]|nr:hypothetical protein [Armatimonadota bacterium]